MKDSLLKREKERIRVLVVTPYTIICESLHILIESNDDMSVTHCLSDLEKFPRNDDSAKSDIALIYLMDGDRESVEMISKVLEIDRDIRVIAVVAGDDINNQTRALELGAVGIVAKEQNARALTTAIRQVATGETWINQALFTKLLNNGKARKQNETEHYGLLNVEVITKREKEVIQMIGKGLKNKDIAEQMFISEATVRHHLSAIYGKIGVEDRLNLVIYAYQYGLIESPKQSIMV